MGDSCCICGLVLANNDDDDVPQWYKDIRALCLVESRPILTNSGYMDHDAVPYNLPISHRYQRFGYHRGSGESPDCCYPFHTACWTLLQECDPRRLLDISTLFRIFQSFHYDSKARARRLGHTFYFEDIFSGTWDTFVAAKADLTSFADPLDFTYGGVVVRSQYQMQCGTPSSIYSGLHLLPLEILEYIICCLDSSDARNLLITSRELLGRYKKSPYNMPSCFWESAFYTHGEMAFAQSSRPPSYTWIDWFFVIKSELSSNPNMRNRRRIWNLIVDLISLVRTTKEPGRILYGSTVVSLSGRIRGSSLSCLASKYDTEGCQQLTEIYVSFSRPSGSLLRSVTPLYVPILNRRLISGFTFTFDAESIHAGYVIGRYRDRVESIVPPKFIWLGASLLGIEAISLTEHSQPPVCFPTPNHGNPLAVAKWNLQNVKGIYLGLDAMRIVTISIESSELENLDDILWAPPSPLGALSVYSDDIGTLYKLQRTSFTPASALHLEPKNGRLIAIKMYSPLGFRAGVTCIGFVYDTSLEIKWGCSDDMASSTFFLDNTEQLANVTVYKIGSLFTTSLYRMSEPFPQLPENPDTLLECIDHNVLNMGDIIGLCGCFVASSKQLNCFGIIGTTEVVSFKSLWLHIGSAASIPPSNRWPGEMPLGGYSNHGQQQSRLQLTKPYQSFQLSINLVETTYRRSGQVTGILFRTSHDISHPHLLGQWAGAGETFHFEEDEQLLDIEAVTCTPKRKVAQRPGLSQVEGLIIVTNRRKITWSRGILQVYREGRQCGERKFKEAIWEFNAIFDRVGCFP